MDGGILGDGIFRCFRGGFGQLCFGDGGEANRIPFQGRFAGILRRGFRCWTLRALQIREIGPCIFQFGDLQLRGIQLRKHCACILQFRHRRLPDIDRSDVQLGKMQQRLQFCVRFRVQLRGGRWFRFLWGVPGWVVKFVENVVQVKFLEFIFVVHMGFPPGYMR